MKPLLDQFCVVTATTSLERSLDCRRSWEQRATYRWPTYCLLNGGTDGANGPYLGTVPAFAEGVRRALAAGHEIIACLHDDLLIEQDGWDHAVALRFINGPKVGLVGFLGGTGLGDGDLYDKPYSPHSLARSGVVSNERNAEAHGQRVRMPQRVAVLDGFSQIGRREFWQGVSRPVLHAAAQIQGVGGLKVTHDQNLYQTMTNWGVAHHAYDAMLGAFAARLGWEVWMLPVACWHQGGQTAVGDAGYNEWAKMIVPGGDQDFWEIAHDICYREFTDVLPIRVPHART